MDNLIVPFRYPHFDEPPICYIQGFAYRNHGLHLVQGVRINLDGTAWIIRPRDYWGLNQCLCVRIQLPDELRKAVELDVREGQFPNLLGDVPTANYDVSSIRTMQAVPTATTPVLIHVDALFGPHLGGRRKSARGDSQQQQDPAQLTGIMKQIADSPNDRTARLDLSNWYRAEGIPFGLFIQVQCELSERGLSEAEEVKLNRRENALLEADMQSRAESLLQSKLGIPIIRRGLVEEITVAANNFDYFLDNASDHVFSAHPALLGLSFVGSLHQDTHLNIDRFANMPEIKRIVSLSWRFCEIGSRGIQSLVSSSFLHSLKTLALYYDAIGDEGASVLGTFSAQLSKLILFENQIGPKGISALMSSPSLIGLNELYLGENQIGDEGILAISISPYLTSLESLTLAYNDIGPKGVQALITSPYLSKLTNLLLIGQAIDEGSKQALMQRYGDAVEVT